MLADGMPAPGLLLEQVDLEWAPLLVAGADGDERRIVGRDRAAPTLARPLPAIAAAGGHARLARVEAPEQKREATGAQFELGADQSVAVVKKVDRGGTCNGYDAIQQRTTMFPERKRNIVKLAGSVARTGATGWHRSR